MSIRHDQILSMRQRINQNLKSKSSYKKRRTRKKAEPEQMTLADFLCSFL